MDHRLSEYRSADTYALGAGQSRSHSVTQFAGRLADASPNRALKTDARRVASLHRYVRMVTESTRAGSRTCEVRLAHHDAGRGRELEFRIAAGWDSGAPYGCGVFRRTREWQGTAGQCSSPRLSVDPMYMPGRLRTASSPSRTVRWRGPRRGGCPRP